MCLHIVKNPNGSFAAEQSHGKNQQTGEQMTHWDMLNKATIKIWIVFVQHVPVRHLLSSLAILYHMIAQLQEAHWQGADW